MSFNIALTGLNAVNEQLNTVSNNIANSGTTGFKSSRTEFGSVYADTQAMGVEVLGLTQSISQGGSLVATGRSLDLAISGGGFFTVRASSGEIQYTRAGVFGTDKDNFITSVGGQRLQGQARAVDIGCGSVGGETPAASRGLDVLQVGHSLGWDRSAAGSQPQDRPGLVPGTACAKLAGACVVIGLHLGDKVDAANTEVVRKVAATMPDAAESVVPAALDTSMRIPLDQARALGPVIAYGNFITLAINFLIVAICIFMVIKLINSVADMVNNDADVDGRLKVIFLPNYNVSLGEISYPAADLSEQISTAGKEASGTGNMKFSMNGALTIGTLDGANVEIREEVGPENFFLFGLTAQEVLDLKDKGYNPMYYYETNEELRQVIDAIRSGYFSPRDPHLFHSVVDSLLHKDEYMHMADFQSYVQCQERVSEAYRDQDTWTRMSILNVARMGKFSSDRTIQEYARDIWGVRPVTVELSATP